MAKAFRYRDNLHHAGLSLGERLLRIVQRQTGGMNGRNGEIFYTPQRSSGGHRALALSRPTPSGRTVRWDTVRRPPNDATRAGIIARHPRSYDREG